MALDESGRISGNRDRFYDIRIERALSEKLGFTYLTSRLLEDVDKGVSYNLSLCLGVGNLSEFAKEQIC